MNTPFIITVYVLGFIVATVLIGHNIHRFAMGCGEGQVMVKSIFGLYQCVGR